MECVQWGMVPGVNEASGGHLEAVQSALISSDIGKEWSILQRLLLMSGLYVSVKWHSQLKQM